MLRGVGLAVGGWMGGLQPASAIVCLNSDGTINVTVGSSDITGTNTAFQPIPAEVLHLPLSLVGVTASDHRTLRRDERRQQDDIPSAAL